MSPLSLSVICFRIILHSRSLRRLLILHPQRIDRPPATGQRPAHGGDHQPVPGPGLSCRITPEPQRAQVRSVQTAGHGLTFGVGREVIDVPGSDQVWI